MLVKIFFKLLKFILWRILKLWAFCKHFLQEYQYLSSKHDVRKDNSDFQIKTVNFILIQQVFIKYLPGNQEVSAI